MDPEERLFAEASQLPESERMAFVDQVCLGDETLHARLVQLLSAHECEDVFVDVARDQASTEIRGIETGDEIGPYRLLEKLGEGGFGVVYRAQQTEPIKRQVAIKVIKPGMDSRSVVARFNAERQALGLMEHPNIANVFDGGASRNGQRPYFVMELVEGISITAFCDQHSMSIRERLELFISICNAVHHAHQKGMIHRDIKPNNVMVRLCDGKPVVKVIDFGVAKALHSRLPESEALTQLGMLVGTPQYMSPEQVEMSGDVDTRSDIYSLSVLLYELVTGSPPLEAQTVRTAGLHELRRLICEVEPKRPSLCLSAAGDQQLRELALRRGTIPARLIREVKGELEWIILKGLRKERCQRYESAKELAVDIRSMLTHQPVLAGPPTLAYRVRKYIRRNRVRLALIAAACGVVVAMLIVVVSHRQQRLAEARKEGIRLNREIDEGNSALVAAAQEPDSSEHWASVELIRDRIENLVCDSSADEATIERAKSVLKRLIIAQKDQQFATSMETLLVSHSTQHSTASLSSMEKAFRLILNERGYDLDTLSSAQVADQLKRDHAPVKVTDALELWLDTRIKLAAMNADGSGIEQSEIENWVNSMNGADPDSLRIAIRQTIFQTLEPKKTTLDNAVVAGKLSQMCARKLAWLAQAYEMVGDTDGAAEIRDVAFAMYPDDLMLNFEHAVRLLNQQEISDAIRYLMRCTSIRPEISGVWRKLAEAFHANNELRQAIKTIKIAIRLEPDRADSQLKLAMWLLQDQRSASALTAAQDSLMLNPDLPEPFLVVGQANMNLGKFSEALVAFKNYRCRAGDRGDARVRRWIDQCQHQIELGR